MSPSLWGAVKHDAGGCASAVRDRTCRSFLGVPASDRTAEHPPAPAAHSKKTVMALTTQNWNSAGRRTAWLRPVMKTLAIWVMAGFLGIDRDMYRHEWSRSSVVLVRLRRPSPRPHTRRKPVVHHHVVHRVLPPRRLPHQRRRS